MIAATVKLWGSNIGAVSQEEPGAPAMFEYDPAFIDSGIEVAPLVMPLSREVYRFPELPARSFHRLPGLLADSLPDRFGNALIDTWLAQQGRSADSFGAIERLCYTGTRGMGALEFSPVTGPKSRVPSDINLEELVKLATDVLMHREGLVESLHESKRSKALQTILKIGTSAGGARPKAVIAWNQKTHEIRSGQVKAEEGFDYWLLKFDTMSPKGEGQDVDQTSGFGAIEYAYYQMAVAAGISMSECRILPEGPRRHFMTKRFDRLPGGGKLHMQSLCAIAHYDFNAAGMYSYEQAMQVIQRLGMPMAVLEEQYRRMVFNVIARNQDDHVKNIAFLMDRSGTWKLAPAYDMTYSYNPVGEWTSQHQMTIHGKRDGFTREDLRSCAASANISRKRADLILGEVHEAVAQWRKWADAASVDPQRRDEIAKYIRLDVGASA